MGICYSLGMGLTLYGIAASDQELLPKLLAEGGLEVEVLHHSRFGTSIRCSLDGIESTLVVRPESVKRLVYVERPGLQDVCPSSPYSKPSSLFPY